MGYYRAGFDVIGVDQVFQPNYPFEFHQGDALDVDLLERLLPVDAIHASPPCQFGTAYGRRPAARGEWCENLIPPTRALLEETGLPYIIENVETNRAHLQDPIRLCGSSFGLDVRRHRLFETNWPVVAPPCNHVWQTPRFPPATNRTNPRRTVEVGAYRCAAIAPAAMEIDWMTNAELTEAIPPAYCEFLGRQLAGFLRARAVTVVRS